MQISHKIPVKDMEDWITINTRPLLVHVYRVIVIHTRPWSATVAPYKSLLNGGHELNLRGHKSANLRDSKNY